MTAGDNLLAEPVTLPTPPSLPPRSKQSAINAALPALGSFAAIGFLAFAPRSPFIYAAGGLIVVVSIAMVAGGISRARRERQDGAAALRNRFLAEIDAARQSLASRHAQVRRARGGATISGEQLHVALATEQVQLTVTFADDEDADPFCRRRAQRLAERGARLDDVPTAVRLGGSTTISATPTDAAALARQLLRAVLGDLTPQQLRIAVLSARPHRWRALRWAPQHHHPHLADASGPARLVASDADELTELLTELDVPLLLIVDGDSTCTPDLQRQARWMVRLVGVDSPADIQLAADGSLTVRRAPHGRGLLCSGAELEAAARAAARGTVPAAQPRGGWAADEPLRPLLGAAPDGSAVHLDLREAGRGGTGPHGLLIGVTGSGKSEVLRTIVAGLLRVHDTDELSLVLVDFKGGATFTPFEHLPHVAATITNLEADPALVSRMSTALGAELRARQAALKQAGAASIDDLRRPMPRLLIIIDEFSELLSAHPEALDVLVQIGRLGRSLGVHLLVAAQRLDEGRIKGLDTHLTYRIALRTASGAESRSVIGVPDAAELTNAPGHGYLRCGSAEPQRFRARYTGAPQPRRPPAGLPVPTPVELRYRNGPLLAQPARVDQRTVLDAALEHAAGRAGTRQAIWVPPPQHSPTHDELYADLAARPGRGYGTLHGAALYGAIGWADRPEEQRIEVAGLDLTSRHAAIIGTTRTGVTTTAVALGISLALRSTPDELHLYLLEAAAGQLGALAALPHCAGHATAGQPGRLAQIVQRVCAVIDQREQVPVDDAPAVVLIIDGYAQLVHQDDTLEAAVLQIATRGLAAGVHLVLTGHSWLGLRARLRDLLAERVELRLGDATESQIDRRAAASLPRDRPGRGLTQQAHRLYVAQPAAAEIIERIRAAWSGARAPGLVELPPMITVHNLSAQVRSAGLVVGVDTATGRAHPLDEDCPLLLIIGDPASGRTSILRSLGRQDAQRGTKLLVIDPRRRLLGDLPAEALLGYAATPSAATELISGLVDGLTKRMPPADITAEQLHERGWWNGPQLHLVVDDYDLLALIGTTLGPLRRFLPYAADLGLRVTIARRAAGAAAALHDETLSVVRDLGASGLLLSRSIDEGPMLGARPGPAPWATGLLVRPAAQPTQLQAIVEPPRRRPGSR